MNAVQKSLIESAMAAEPVSDPLAERIRSLRERTEKGERWLAEQREAGQDHGPRYERHQRLWLELLGELDELAQRCKHRERTAAVIVEGGDGKQYQEDSCALCGFGWRRVPVEGKEPRPEYTRETPTPKPDEACFVCGSTEYVWHDITDLYGLWQCVGCGPKAVRHA